MNDDQKLRDAYNRLASDSSRSATNERLYQIKGLKTKDRWVPVFGLVIAVPLLVALLGFLYPLSFGDRSDVAGVVSTTSTTLIAEEPDETVPFEPRPDGASQEPDAAVRDGVVPAVAVLSMVERIGEWGETPGTQTDEGFWTLGRMNPSAGGNDCIVGNDQGVYGIDFVCADSYGELLLMSSDGNEVLAAYPMPDVPPTWLIVTDEAIYCGRPGTSELPVSALCRVDRESGDFQVRLFAIVGDGFEGSIQLPSPVELAQRPGRWSVGDDSVSSKLAFGQLIDGKVMVDGGMLVDDELHLSAAGAVDPVPLPIESGGSYVSSGDEALDEVALQLIEFARGGEPLFMVADSVTLRLGMDITVSVLGTDLVQNRAAWTLEAEAFEGFSGPFNILDVIEQNLDVAFTAGPVPHCAGPERDYWAAAELVRAPVSITPTDATSCIEWSNVVIRINEDGVIQEVILDLFGP